MSENSENHNVRTRQIWAKAGIYGLIATLILIFRATFNILLLVLAGVLIAFYFRGLSELICRKTKWKQSICMTVSVAGSILLLGGLFWLIGAEVQDQLQKLSDMLPAMMQQAKAQLSQSPIGQEIVQRLSSPRSMEKARQFATTFFSTTFGILGDVYAVLLIGAYLTASPLLYKKGIIAVVPPEGKKKAGDVLNKLGDTLKGWLKGKLFAMAIVFVLTAIGLVIIGVPMWLVLALLAGLLSFIPNFGPLIAMILAVLVGLTQGTATTLLIVGLYITVQFLESNIITPKIQKELIQIPPALIITSQLFMGVLTGGWGLVLATPLAGLLIVAIRELWVKKQKEGGQTK